MQFKKTLPRLALIVCLLASGIAVPQLGQAQNTYLLQGDKQNLILERMEIRAGSDSILNFSKTRPYNRGKYVMAGTKSFLKDHPLASLSKVDQYNVRSLYLNNFEYIDSADRGQYLSRKPVWKHFYKTPANLVDVHVKDFDLVLSPVFQYTLSKESGNDQSLFLNTRGIVMRGNIARKIGFAAYMTDNQERDPLYVQDYINTRRAVPGNGLYKTFKDPGGVDYFDARGYVSFNATKYIDVVFGYDKNFIGNGQRSLFLSDFGNNNLFLKLNTRIWKINYQNLFMEVQQARIPGNDTLIDKKYVAIHHLDVDVTKWLNIGLFEAIVFGRKNRFDFAYMNPVIFYRSIEAQNGSLDNSLAGLDIKANIAKKFQVYGQLMLDEFNLEQVKAGTGWWANKFGMQIGAKYIDAFGIPNLDLQVEHNRVRPFTYSHYDSIANYTHYNQPMAHPLMANFQEFIGVARYQPAPRWFVQAKAIYYIQGRDSGAVSYGSNIFLPNEPPYRVNDFGYSIGSGWKTNVLYSSLLVSYELKQNLFVELNGVYRKLSTKTAPIVDGSTSVISFGVRWNMHRRDYEF